MRSRRAFTLIEVMIAITIGGLVALLVYGSARAGLDSSDRIARHRDVVESQSIMRALIAGALRHPADASTGSDAVFALDDLVDAAGVPRDRIELLSRGLVPPLGGTAIWRVRLETTDRGLVFTAVPVSGDSTRRISATLAAVRGIEASVMSLGERVWVSQWSSPNQMPAAVSLRFVGAPGDAVMPPLVIRTDLGALP